MCAFSAASAAHHSLVHRDSRASHRGRAVLTTVAIRPQVIARMTQKLQSGAGAGKIGEGQASIGSRTAPTATCSFCSSHQVLLKRSSREVALAEHASGEREQRPKNDLQQVGGAW